MGKPKTAAGAASTDDAREAFNGADPARFDHDGDGAPGGSLPTDADANAVRVPVVGLETGVIGTIDDPAALDPATQRLATVDDLLIGGRPELIPGVVAPPQPDPEPAPEPDAGDA